MVKYIATVFYKGIGNETIHIHAANEEYAFKYLFNYCSDKGERLGYWIDGNGEDAGDFNSTDGIFESEPEWSWLITKESETKSIGDDAKYERTFFGWTIDDVVSMYPTITKEQAYEILCFTEKDADFEIDVSYDTIETTASILFPELKRDDADGENDS